MPKYLVTMSAVTPGSSTTQATGRSPRGQSDIPMTAASATRGCAISSFSSMTELIHSPPDLITALDRSARSHPSAVKWSNEPGSS